MDNNLVVLKLGGALLTDKATPNTLLTQTLRSCAEEIATARREGLIDRLILVHGVGSYGHPQVLKHHLHEGYSTPEQLLPLSITQSNVMSLRAALLDVLQAVDVPAWQIMPSSCLTTRNGVLEVSFWDALAQILKLGVVPLLGGDIAFDSACGFSVISGDVLAVQLAMHFRARRLYFASAVDGIFDTDPARHTDARRIPLFRLQHDRLEVDEPCWLDATGAMSGKIRALREARGVMLSGMEARVFSMRVRGQLLRLLRNDADIGTEIVP